MEICIEGLKVSASLGVYEWEKAAPRDVLLDLILTYDANKAAASDAVDDCLDYDRVKEAVIECCTARHYDLIETLVQAMMNVLFGFPQLQKATVTLTKPDAMPEAERLSVRHTQARGSKS